MFICNSVVFSVFSECILLDSTSFEICRRIEMEAQFRIVSTGIHHTCQAFFWTLKKSSSKKNSSRKKLEQIFQKKTKVNNSKTSPTRMDFFLLPKALKIQ